MKQLRCFMFALACVLPASAALTAGGACESGTIAEWNALGSTGCTSGAYTLNLTILANVGVGLTDDSLVTFSRTTGGDMAEYIWDFPDLYADTSTEDNPVNWPGLLQVSYSFISPLPVSGYFAFGASGHNALADLDVPSRSFANLTTSTFTQKTFVKAEQPGGYAHKLFSLGLPEDPFAPTPEPASMMLLGGGLGVLALLRKRL